MIAFAIGIDIQKAQGQKSAIWSFCTQCDTWPVRKHTKNVIIRIAWHGGSILYAKQPAFFIQ